MEYSLQVENLCYTYPEAAEPALSGATFDLRKGECICLAGHSGCGKSTLLLAIKGLLRDGSMSGNLRHDGKILTEDTRLGGLGLVFQNPESQLLCATVFDEVAFGPENLCLAPTEIHRRIVRSLDAVSLLEFGNRNVERFSAGQKQRLCIASILSMEPGVILLDEPSSQLDRRGKDDLCAVLTTLKDRGISIIIAEHNIEPFTSLIDRFYLMTDGKITGVQDSAPVQYLRKKGNSVKKTGYGNNLPAAVPLLSAEKLSVSYPGSGTILHDVSLSVSAGELLHLFGENGCGKSTLLRAFAGAMQPDSGRLLLKGLNYPQSGGLLGTVSLLFQNPQRQLFEDTVYDEVAFTLKRLKLPVMEIGDRARRSLAACEASHLADRLPLTLSFGEQHRVALASVIAPDPMVLLLDEPFAGLDPDQRLRIMDILARLRSERGTAIIIASHDPLPDPDWADRIICMEKGRIVDDEK